MSIINNITVMHQFISPNKRFQESEIWKCEVICWFRWTTYWVSVVFLAREFCIVNISVLLKLCETSYFTAPVIFFYSETLTRSRCRIQTKSLILHLFLSISLSLSYGNVQTPLVNYRTSLSVPVSWLYASWLETLSEQPIKTSLEIRQPLFQLSNSPVFIFGLISKSRDEHAIMSWCLSLSLTRREREQYWWRIIFSIITALRLKL